MNVFLHELKMYRKSTIIWSLGISGAMIFFMMFYPTFSDGADVVKKALQGFPEVVRKAFGLYIDIITSFTGYYSYVFMYIMLCGAIQAMNFGTSMLSKEVRDKTADFLMTKPISRKKIMTSKLLAIVVSLIATNIVYLSSAIIMTKVLKPDNLDIQIFIMISLSLFFIQVIFASFGVVISVLAKKIKSVLSVSLGTVFSFFIISMFGSVIGEEKVKYITPFKYFDSVNIIKNSQYDYPLLAVGAFIVITAVAISYIIYVKRDIHAV